MNRRGFMFTDALLAVGVLAAAAALLGGGMSQVYRANRTIGDNEIALHAANETLLSLQTRQLVLPTDVRVELVELPTPAPAGWRWVRVNAHHRTGHAEIIGLARRGS